MGLPALARSEGIVLRRPQHFHVSIIAYQYANAAGEFQMSTRFTYIVNAIAAAEFQAEREAKPEQQNFHVHEVEQCWDPRHLKGIPD